MRSLMLAALACAAATVAAAQTPPPAAAFGRLPGVQDAAISPDGRKVAMLGGPAGDRVLTIATIDQPGLPTLKLGDAETVGIRWAGDEYVLARIAFWDKFGPRNAYRFERNVAVNLQAKAVSRLLEHDNASSYQLSHSVMGIVQGPPARVLLAGSIDSGPAIWSIDPATGRGVITERGGDGLEGWSVDLAGEARVKRTYYGSGAYVIWGRAKGVSKWSEVWNTMEPNASEQYRGYSDPDDAIYFMRPGADGLQLSRQKLTDGTVETLGRPVTGSDAHLGWDEHRKTAVAIVSGRESSAIEWLDPELGAVFRTLAGALKGHRVVLANWSKDRTRFVLATDDIDAPPVWYMFDRARKELSPIGQAYPELAGAALGKTRWITYKARDGLEIPAYVTLPPGAPETGGKLPLVVLPHGGPSARDDDSFDYLTHFLATRGYVVLRPQFRGSIGFGRDFERAGEGEWGRKMQSDLVDGIQFLAASGSVDPGRVCIVGVSFGGYSAMVSTVVHPEAYRCAAAVAGISDLGALMVDELVLYGPEADGANSLRRMIGASGARRESIETTSPRRRVADIKVPILLVHADKDTVVLPSQSIAMADALRKAGKPVELVILADDDHYLMKSATRTQMLDAVGAFLARNLPVTP